MLVAVALFGDEVSPRFGNTTELMLAQVGSRTIQSLRRLAIPAGGGYQLIRLLSSLKPVVFICGGIHRHWQRMLEGEGITVVWGIIGRAEDALNSYIAGSLNSNQFVCPGRRSGKGRKRYRKGMQRGQIR